MITLYHGTNIDFDDIDLGKCKPNKDFGRGFYLTDIRAQAEEMATRRFRITETGMAQVLSFSFDESLLHSPLLNVKIFNEPSKEWALFVLENRQANRTGYKHEYDIVIGPVADDGVAFQLERYTRNLISIEMLVEELTYRKLNKQYFFGTEVAISKLKRI